MPPVELTCEADSCLRSLRWSFVGPLLSAVAGSVETLPPSFSHRSSIFFFRRFLAVLSGITVSSFSTHCATIRSAFRYATGPLLTPRQPTIHRLPAWSNRRVVAVLLAVILLRTGSCTRSPGWGSFPARASLTASIKTFDAFRTSWCNASSRSNASWLVAYGS